MFSSRTLLEFPRTPNRDVIINPYMFGGGACNVPGDFFLQSYNYDDYLGAFNGYQYKAVQFVATSSYLVCRAAVELFRYGIPAWSLTARIWSHDGVNNQPASPIGSASSSVTALSVSDSAPAMIDFNLAATLVSGSTYWIVLYAPATTYPDYLAPSFAQNAGGATIVNGVMRSGDGVTWFDNSIADIFRLRFQLYHS